MKGKVTFDRILSKNAKKDEMLLSTLSAVLTILPVNNNSNNINNTNYTNRVSTISGNYNTALNLSYVLGTCTWSITNAYKNCINDIEDNERVDNRLERTSLNQHSPSSYDCSNSLSGKTHIANRTDFNFEIRENCLLEVCCKRFFILLCLQSVNCHKALVEPRLLFKTLAQGITQNHVVVIRLLITQPNPRL